MKELKEVLREIANSGIKETCILIQDGTRTELGKFLEEHGKDYIRKLEVEEVRYNSLFAQYEIVVKEKKDECK